MHEQMAAKPNATTRDLTYCTHPTQTWCDCDWCRYIADQKKEKCDTCASVARAEGCAHVYGDGSADPHPTERGARERRR